MSASIDWVACALCDKLEEYWTWNGDAPPSYYVCSVCTQRQQPLWCPTCSQPVWSATMCPKRSEPCGLEPHYEEDEHDS